ncbi:MAG: hypothetical protein GX594_01750 [Pirellulaceae bacterium]|nr:hypothetical protein [Pirellulaceae bacterium]
MLKNVFWNSSISKTRSNDLTKTNEHKCILSIDLGQPPPQFVGIAARLLGMEVPRRPGREIYAFLSQGGARRQRSQHGGKNTSDAAKGLTALSRKDFRNAAGRFTDGDALKNRDE